MFCARNAAASPIELARYARRSMPSFFEFSSAISPISFSTFFWFSFCGRGMNSSLDPTWVGRGASPPLSRSRFHFGIHMELLHLVWWTGRMWSPRRRELTPVDGSLHLYFHARRHRSVGE